MPPTLTPEAVAALAPDPASLKAGQKLVSPAKWPTLANDGDVLWGEAQGSGAHPYLVAADLRTPDIATKCSCPSRKFPCKHALGLLLLHAAGTGNWQAAAVPEELNRWLEGRVQRSETREQKEKQEADPAAQAKRQAAREKKMTAGLDALALWLADLVREGLLAARTRGYGEWDGQAARLVDAQLPGAARLVRQIPDLLHEESGEALTAHLGRLYLLTRAWASRESLSAEERADLLTALGLPLDRAGLIPSTTEDWLCMGSVTEEEGRLTVRRTWLLGAAGETALLLDFAPQNAALGAGFPTLARLRGAPAYAPSAFPQRAVLEGALEGGSAFATKLLALPPALPLADLPRHWAQALARNPWLDRTGVLLGPVYFGTRQLCDYGGLAVPLSADLGSDTLWQLKAQADTEPALVFGEWDGQAFLPLVVLQQGEAL